jgi:hypothetical protein
MKRFLLLAGIAACSAPRVAPEPVPSTPAPTIAGDVISIDDLRRDLFAFADDSMRGRESGTVDGLRASRFLADRLLAMGLEPAGDSGFFQRVPLQREGFGTGTQFSVNDGSRTTALPLGKALVPLLNLGEGAPEPKHAASGEVVFLGHLGDAATAQRELAGIDLRGKVAVVLHGAPPGSDSATRARLESQDMLSMRIGLPIQRGPAAVILLMHDGTEQTYERFAPELLRSMGAAKSGGSQSDAERPLPMILMGLAKEAEGLLPANWRSARPQALEGRRFTGRLEVRRETVMSYNVLAIVRGSDPRMNRSFVAYGAHLDHIGIQSGSRDSIANGADDDGSGSIALLALARAFKNAPVKPRRSILLVWHTAEEKGLLGSQHFVDRPTVPIDSIVAQINADMIGRNGAASETGAIPPDAPARIFIVGPGAAENNQSRVLGQIVDSVNARQPRPFTFDREWDSPTHPERIYFRSDHYSYAKKGIPIVFFTTGLHGDYHKVSDHPDKIDYDKLSRVTRLLLDVGTAVANRPTRPR